MKLSNLPAAIFHYCVRSAEMTGSPGGMDVGDGGRSDEHVNQTSVLAYSPLSCLAVCMAWVACVAMVTALCVCMFVSVIERLLLLEDCSV